MIAVSKGRRMKFTIVAVGKLKEKFWTAASHTINETKGRVNVSSSRERSSPLSPE